MLQTALFVCFDGGFANLTTRSLTGGLQFSSRFLLVSITVMQKSSYIDAYDSGVFLGITGTGQNFSYG